MTKRRNKKERTIEEMVMNIKKELIDKDEKIRTVEGRLIEGRVKNRR